MATIKGQNVKRICVQKYIARLRESGRTISTHSCFYVGLFSQNWVNFLDNCWRIVEHVIRLNRNKLEHYLRGMRAMKLILSTF